MADPVPAPTHSASPAPCQASWAVMTAAQVAAGPASAFLPVRVLATLIASPLAPLLLATRSLWPRMVERAHIL